MALNQLPSAHDCWQSSPSMDWSDQSPIASPSYSPAKSLWLDTEFHSEATPIDLDSWYPQYLRCTQYFLEQGQFAPAVQSLAAFLNIRLPCQRVERQTSSDAGGQEAAAHVLLRRYIRRLVVTAHDSPEVLMAFFGAEWTGGVGCVVQQERQTYLFTAKSSGWAATKAAYDLLPDEQTPFLRPLRAPAEEELRLAESRWSDWNGEKEEEEEEPWLIAYTDLFAGRETQVVIYSSEEASASSNEGDQILSLLTTPTNPQRVRAQLLALFRYIKTHLLPVYTAHRASEDAAKEAAGDHQLAPPPPQAFLVGNLHTGLFALLFAGAFVPGIKIHRYDHAPYVKYLFGSDVVRRGGGSARTDKTEASNHADNLDFRFHTRSGKQGVLPRHFALVRSRTVIHRSDATLAVLPGAAVYVDRDGCGDEDGEKKGEEEEEDPVAWAFLGPDGSLATLHVEEEYRGQGLAGRVASEAMRRGMVEDERWKDYGELLVHTNVAMGNGASRRVMRKLGGRVGWTVTWTVVEVV
ncbi:uncharacterized protein BO97DRAFT_470438 [Aspergillus homomorphus CBS 101889]|uniref:GCN5-related N-acetyltransferase Rv2170-like domain-containing protein n=1 Tax=Aspergillus homomorphus (strain CBS 101889) TaxID=1450537 RepID=A0A395HWQ6_ASPHC|nr:hypothetical protein BO97DRAFT_470438 [Aspergillus homomorphus CBS 101889]RAL12227.1 hypothetical protein BO97DRAFT_470438 [Aspergillus homomorphus CBS 101889]